MADEQRTLSEQINSLATRVAREIKELKSSVGTGATGTVKTVNGNEPTTDGNVTLTAEDVNALSCDGGSVAGDIAATGTVSGSTLKVGGSDVKSLFVPKTGERGMLTGYTLGRTINGAALNTSTLNIGEGSYEYTHTNNCLVNVANGTVSASAANGVTHHCWIKVVYWVPSTNGTPTLTLGDKWEWSREETPTITKGIYVFMWLGYKGIALKAA